MKIILKSTVNCPINIVHHNFDEDLFKYLLPPGAKLIEYGGSKTGDTVHLKLPVAGAWISKITDHRERKDQVFFVDEGSTLPFPLKRWKHKHILHKKDKETIIEDSIEFSSGYLMVDILIYPFLFLAFAPRIRQYKKFFSKFDRE